MATPSRQARCEKKEERNMEEFRVIENCLMIRLPEEVDHHRSAYIGERADKFILEETVKHVVFDFGDTKFMDSSGIGIIVGRYKKISCFGGRVYIIHADKQIRRILRMSGLDQIVEIMERQEK
jgi:stage II sporulation protein AA (anti-sigma F factor antagonist)